MSHAVRLGPAGVREVARTCRSSSGRSSKACHCHCLESNFEGSARRISRDLQLVRGRLFRLRGALDPLPDRSGRSSFCPFSTGMCQNKLQDCQFLTEIAKSYTRETMDIYSNLRLTILSGASDSIFQRENV